MPEAKYHDIQADLLKKIKDGTYSEGQLIPTEIELAQKFGVSRPTASHAIRNLVNQGYLERRKKRGTIVKHQKNTSSFTQVINNQTDPALKMQVLFVKKIPVNSKIQKILDLTEDALVYKISRLRFADHEPIGLITSYLPANLIKKVDALDLERNFLKHELAKQKLIITHTQKKIEVKKADETSSELLNISPNSPVFYIHTVLSTSTNQKVVYSLATYRGDLNYFVLDLEK